MFWQERAARPRLGRSRRVPWRRLRRPRRWLQAEAEPDVLAAAQAPAGAGGAAAGEVEPEVSSSLSAGEVWRLRELAELSPSNRGRAQGAPAAPPDGSWWRQHLGAAPPDQPGSKRQAHKRKGASGTGLALCPGETTGDPIEEFSSSAPNSPSCDFVPASP